MKNRSWEEIFNKFNIYEHDFKKSYFVITADDIKKATQNFTKTTEKEVRILCKQDTRESRPDIFKEMGLFILPIQNGVFAIIKGEGYIDIPEITDNTEIYKSKLGFELVSSKIGDSEMQHLDFAYASSLVRTFMKDDSLILTIRGRKRTPKLNFNIGKFNIEIKGVQTEVDAGYEGKDKIVLVEAKNSKTTNTIIRQLYYPYRQWEEGTGKNIITLFFEKRKNKYSFWEFVFKDKNNYESIYLVKSKAFEIK